MSNDISHDTSFVWKLQDVLCTYREKFAAVNTLEYFSDGCVGQYKNFLNLTYHEMILD